MLYRVIGLMSGSSLDGLDIVYTHFLEKGGQWEFSIEAAECISYSDEWVEKLRHAVHLSARDYMLLHTAYGHYTGQLVRDFMERRGLQHQVQLISSHGHTTFHEPSRQMTAQLGDGAAIAAETGINVVTDLRAMDIALGGQGAPIVPVGEKLLWPDYSLLLNIGGIANLSARLNGSYIAFDICPANRVLNMLAETAGKPYDEGGRWAASGVVRDEQLSRLNQLDYYAQPYPKSLANDFGVDTVFPLLAKSGLPTRDALRTMVEHIVIQTTRSIGKLTSKLSDHPPYKLLATGGGAFNTFLTERLSQHLAPMQVEVVVPDASIVNFKEALVMGLLGVLRWREADTVLSSVTGASRNSIGGAVWIGQEA